MQDIYAFDVGDFGKLGLLRQICVSGKLRLAVLWWKTDLGTVGADGKHVDYLQDRSFRDCDPQLWEQMRQHFNPGARRIIDLHPLLPNDTVFHDAPVPGDAWSRTRAGGPDVPRREPGAANRLAR
jgi:hypothetical protein